MLTKLMLTNPEDAASVKTANTSTKSISQTEEWISLFFFLRKKASLAIIHSKKQKEKQSRTQKKQFILHCSWTCAISNVQNWTRHSRSTEGASYYVVIAVKDDSGSYAVFNEQRSSASHMTAAKVSDVNSRLPDCAGEASDAVTQYTQLTMEDASKLLRSLEAECPVIWIRSPRSRSPKSWDNIPDLADIQGKSTKMGMLLHNSNKWLISISLCAWNMLQNCPRQFAHGEEEREGGETKVGEEGRERW